MQFLLLCWFHAKKAIAYYPREYVGVLVPAPAALVRLAAAAIATAEPGELLTDFRLTLASTAVSSRKLATDVETELAALRLAHAAVPSDTADILTLKRDSDALVGVQRALEAASSAMRNLAYVRQQQVLGGRLSPSARWRRHHDVWKAIVAIVHAGTTRRRLRRRCRHSGWRRSRWDCGRRRARCHSPVDARRHGCPLQLTRSLFPGDARASAALAGAGAGLQPRRHCQRTPAAPLSVPVLRHQCQCRC
jgi:hypothetical protein